MEGSLQERLDAYSHAVKEHLPDYAGAVDRLVERLSIAGARSAAPRPGEPMPPFLLPDEEGRSVSMDELLRGPLAITFHRGHLVPIVPHQRSHLGARTRAWLARGWS